MQIHYSELPDLKPGDPLQQAWNVYRREAGRLIAEGHEKKFVLINGDEIVGLFETWGDASQEGYRRSLHEPFLIRQVLTYEPILKVRGYNLPCPLFDIRLARPA